MKLLYYSCTNRSSLSNADLKTDQSRIHFVVFFKIFDLHELWRELCDMHMLQVLGL